MIHQNSWILFTQSNWIINWFCALNIKKKEFGVKASSKIGKEWLAKTNEIFKFKFESFGPINGIFIETNTRFGIKRKLNWVVDVSTIAHRQHTPSAMNIEMNAEEDDKMMLKWFIIVLEKSHCNSMVHTPLLLALLSHKSHEFIYDSL